MKKIIYIPIEVKKREFISKLFFISRALKRNYSCIIGDKISIQRSVRFFGSGVYFYKSMSFYDTKHIRKMKQYGNKYIVQDEEGSVESEKEFEKFVKIRGSNQNLELIDRYYNWGFFDSKIWKKNYIKYKKKFVITGSPRVDVLNQKIAQKIYNLEISNIKEYGAFVLVISSGISSNKELKKKIKVDLATRSPLGENIKFIKERNSWQKKLYLDMIDITISLARKNKDKIIVFRPHPDEDQNTILLKKLRKFKNIKIANEFDVIPWVIQSEVIVHSCSTVALQAYFLKKNVISYEPKYIKNSHRKFPNIVGLKSKNLSNIHLNMKKINFKKINNKNFYKRFYKDKKKYSSDLIIDDLSKNFHIKNQRINFLKIIFLNLIFYFKDNIFKFLRFSNSQDLSYYKTRRSYYEKNPGIYFNEIKSFFDHLNIKKIKIKKCFENAYYISND
jgi:surface carbohydrate biosynthesis protein